MERGDWSNMGLVHKTIAINKLLVLLHESMDEGMDNEGFEDEQESKAIAICMTRLKMLGAK